MDAWMVGSCVAAWVNKGEKSPFSLTNRIRDSLGLWYPIQQRQAVQVGSQTCLGLRSFLARGCYMDLARCFLCHPSGNLGIWLKLWYFVLFLFLVLTPRLLFFLSMSASTDASWPVGPVNPFQPAPQIALPVLHIAWSCYEPIWLLALWCLWHWHSSHSAWFLQSHQDASEELGLSTDREGKW